MYVDQTRPTQNFSERTRIGIIQLVRTKGGMSTLILVSEL